MYNFITDLLNIDEKTIKNITVSKNDELTEFHIILNPENLSCPYCGGSAHAFGFAKPKTINHPALTGGASVIVFKPRRYRCCECLKTFSGTNPFAFSAFKNSYFALDNVMRNLANLNYTYKMVADINHISVTQVQRYFDSFVSIPRMRLPESIGIDEIHSRMAGRKDSAYLCVMVDNQQRTLFEILPSRSKNELSRYFDKISEAERNSVKYVTIDMWQPYKDIALKYFKNAAIAVDPFHVVKHLTESFSRIRLNILYQVEHGSDSYYLLKTWKDLVEKDSFLDNAPRFNSRFKRYLSKRDLQNMIFDISENLTLGYRLKEMYLKFNKEATEDNCEAWFKTVLAAFKESHISEYDEFVSMLERWEAEILNSFKRPYDDRKLSNALSENINGKIRTYLSISNGITNFIRFRKRCLFALNHKIFYSITSRLKTDKSQGKPRGKYNKTIDNKQ